jgi:hypothetical protein
MGAFLVKNCKDCSEIDSLKDDINKKIYDITKSMLFKVVYLADKKICKDTLKSLIYYKSILEKMSYNSATFESIATRKQIISHIKKLLY